MSLIAIAGLLVHVAMAEPSLGSADVTVIVRERAADDLDERVLAGVRAAARERSHAATFVRVAETTGDRVASAREIVGAGGAAAHVVWIEVEDARIAVYVVALPAGRLFVRAVEVTAGQGAVAVESAINIAAAALDVAVDPQLLGLTEVAPTPEIAAPAQADPPAEPTATDTAASEVREPLRERSPPERTARRSRRDRSASTGAENFLAGLAIGYAGTTFASRVPWQSTIAISATLYPVPRAVIGLRYDAALPIDVRASASFRLWRHPVALFAGFRQAFARRWDVELLAHLAVDPIRRRGDAGDSQISVTGDATRVLVSAGASLGLGVHVHPRVRLGVAVRGEGLLTRTAWVVRDPERRVVLAPQIGRGAVEAQIRVFWGRRRRSTPAVTHRARRSPLAGVTCTPHAPACSGATR